MSFHANEIGGTQMAPELAYDLCNGMMLKPYPRRSDIFIGSNVNPDGQIMVTDWYNQWVGTEYEGCELPGLYHKYAGHADKSAISFSGNLVELKVCK